MTNEQLIAKFNPASGTPLSPEDLETLHGLTDAQIDVLADAYPNQPTRRAYLRLYDKNLTLEKQLYQLSTWQNLRNVRKFSNRKNLIAWDFYNTSTKFAEQQKRPVTGKATSSPKKVVVDLTAKEAADELTKTFVDKKAAGAAKEKAAPAPKPATSAKKSGKLKAVKAGESVVDNSSLPDDQQIGNGGAE